MSRPLFRREAIEHRAKARAAGRVLAWRDRLAARAFIVLLTAVVASAAASYVLRVEESTSGTATRGATGDLVLLLPIGVARRLAVGQPVRIGAATTRISALAAPRTVDDVTYAVAHAPSPVGPVTVPATVRVVLARHRLAIAIVPALGR